MWMETYTTLDGGVLDLFWLEGVEHAFAERIIAMYQANTDWREFSNIIVSSENPLIRDTEGRVTREVWEHPLFQMARDLEDRLGIMQGHLATPDDPVEVDRDPFEDDWMPVAEAADHKGVTPQGLYGAIRRGDVIARPRKPGDPWTQVSRRSLDSWKPNELRQAARKRTTVSV